MNPVGSHILFIDDTPIGYARSRGIQCETASRSSIIFENKLVLYGFVFGLCYLEPCRFESFQSKMTIKYLEKKEQNTPNLLIEDRICF